jgi:hypothetical protein
MNASLKQYIVETIKDIDFENLTVHKEKLNGLSNDVYLISVSYNNTLLSQFIFRLFGINHQQSDSVLEKYIITKLSVSGLTPKVLATDDTTYRIEQYIDAVHPLHTQVLNQNMLDHLTTVLIEYSKISPMYNGVTWVSKLTGDTELLLVRSEGDAGVSTNNQLYDIKYSIFDMLMNKTYPQALGNLKSIMGGSGYMYRTETLGKLYRLKDFLDNFKSNFLTVFPKSSLFLLNHNDIHRLNILLKSDGDGLILLDHEYACLNLVGNDIVNYMIETCWDYTLPTFPYYTYKRENFDFNLFYSVYTNYLDKLTEAYKDDLTSYNKKVYEQLYTMPQLLRIICIISSLWTLYSIEYLTPSNLEDETNYDTLGSAVDRLEMFEVAYQQLVKYLK